MSSIRFTLKTEEHAAAIRHLRVHHRANWLFAALGAAFIADGVATHGWALGRGFLIGVGGLYLWMILCGMVISPGSAARKADKTRTESTYEFSEASLTFHTSVTTHAVGWADVTKFKRATRLSVLVTASGLMYMIPDRAFATPDEAAAFVALVTRRRAETAA